MIFIFIWIVDSTPEIFYHDVLPSSGACVYTNSAYNDYATISFFGLHFGLPVLILMVFGYLSYRNIYQIRTLVNQQVNRQLTKMTIMQAALICISLVPYGIFFSYSFTTVRVIKSVDQKMREYLIATTVSLISYVHFAVCLAF